MRTRTRKLLTSSVIALMAVASCGGQATPRRDLRVQTVESKVFNNTRNIRVLLPPGYETTSRTYPVLYLNDGQNLFDKADSVFNNAEWKADETVHQLIAEGEIEPIIVVGVDNAGTEMRPNEYLPWEDEYLSPPMPEPNGALYPVFLEKEVIPFVETKYRVRSDRAGRALGGSSYGALIALYTALERPNLFGKLLLESPSFYVSDAKVLDIAESTDRLPLKVYLGVGTNEMGAKECGPEADGGEAVTDLRRLESILKKKGLAARDLKTVIEECTVHHEDAWARRLPEALRFLFPPN